MSDLEDDDGIDGPFEAAMLAAEAEDRRAQSLRDLDGSGRLGAAFSKLREPRKAFEVPPSQITRRAFDALNARARAVRKALVKPANALDLVAQIAELEEGDRLHAITPGHYVFGDLLTRLLDRARPPIFHVCTLSMSTANVDDLAARIDAGAVGEIRMLLSDYFANTNGAIFEHAKAVAASRRWPIAVCRTHAKVALLAPRLVIETSANLRSSQNIEQITAIADAELYAFHRAWMDPLFGGAA